MSEQTVRYAPGRVRDAILQVMNRTSDGLTAKQIADRVASVIGPTPESSVRSFLRLNTPDLFVKERRGHHGPDLRRAGATAGAALARN